MDEYVFIPHLVRSMAMRWIPAIAIYHVIENADDVVVQPNGRTRYTGTWESRVIEVVVGADERTIVTVWERTRESRRKRRRRR